MAAFDHYGESGHVRVAVTGSSGLIGSALVRALRAEGHDVLRLVRHAPAQDDEVGWNPEAGVLDPADLAGVDGVVHLAGAGLGDRRWNDSYKRAVLRSRVEGTGTLAEAMVAAAAGGDGPRVLVSGSAIGWYGDTGDRIVDESSHGGVIGSHGVGFLADVVEQWERASDPARHAGLRVVNARSGLVVAREGTWGRLTPLFKLGVGGPMGDGRQYWSFISLEDEVRALILALTDDRLHGPVNLTAPHPLTNAEMARTMGHVLHRPAVLPVPGFALRVVVGEFSEAIVTGQRVLPRRLEEVGFTFRHPTFEDAYRAALAG